MPQIVFLLIKMSLLLKQNWLKKKNINVKKVNVIFNFYKHNIQYIFLWYN